MKKTLLIIIIACTGQLGFAQSSSALLKSHFKAIAKEQASYLSKEQMADLYADVAVIEALNEYLVSDKVEVQREAIRLTGKVGSQHLETESRQRAVFQLLTVVPLVSDILVEQVRRPKRLECLS